MRWPLGPPSSVWTSAGECDRLAQELPLFRNMVLPLSLEPQRSDELVEGGELSELDKLREDASADAEP